MALFSKRPLLLALFIFIATTIISSALGNTVRVFSLIAIVILASASFVYFLIINGNKKSAFNILLCLSFATVALLSSYYFFNVKLATAEGYNGTAQITARIDECTYSASYTSVYKAKLLSVNEKETDVFIELSSNGPTDFTRGDIIKAEANFLPFDEDRFGFNERKNNISKNILAYAEFETAEIINNTGNSIVYLLPNIREFLNKRLDLNAGKSSGLIKALLLGNRDDLESGTTLNFRRMGISHILSISGTHFTILLGMLAMILSALGINKKTAYFMLIFVAVFYMGLTGFSEAVCRAGIMSVITYLAFLLGRTYDSYTALGIAVVIILLFSPNAVLSISLWLSFSATLAILILNELIFDLKKSFIKLNLFAKIIFALLTNLFLSALISLITLPIVAGVFGEISLISPLTNLIVVPLITLFLYISPLCLIFPEFYPLTFACDLLYEFVLNLCEKICRIDNLLVSLKYPFVLPISVLGTIAFIVLLALPLKKKLAVLLPPLIAVLTIAICICIFNYINFDKSDLTYFVQGGNDGIVITAENECMCIDISSGASNSAYRAEHIAEKNYSPEISAFMFTHYHSLHISMFAKMCARTNVQSVFLPKTDADTAGYMYSVANVASENNVEIFWFDYNQPIKFNGCEITVFSPAYISRSTHPVICLAISNGDNDVLYLGSSFNDTKIDYSENVSGAEYIIFGQHSPVAKKSFDIQSKAVLIFGNSSVYALSQSNKNGETVKEDEEYRILLKKPRFFIKDFDFFN